MSSERMQRQHIESALAENYRRSGLTADELASRSELSLTALGDVMRVKAGVDPAIVALVIDVLDHAVRKTGQEPVSYAVRPDGAD